MCPAGCETNEFRLPQQVRDFVVVWLVRQVQLAVVVFEDQLDRCRFLMMCPCKIVPTSEQIKLTRQAGKLSQRPLFKPGNLCRPLVQSVAVMPFPVPQPVADCPLLRLINTLQNCPASLRNADAVGEENPKAALEFLSPSASLR